MQPQPSPAYRPRSVLIIDDHDIVRFGLETLVHGAVIAGSVGLVVSGLSGLGGAAGEVRRRRRKPKTSACPAS